MGTTSPDLLPSASAVYARKVQHLTEALNKPEERPQAAEALRLLIEKIVLTPGPEKGAIDALLYGELGTILNWIERQAIGKATKNNTPGAGFSGVSVSVVAGAGSDHNLRPAPAKMVAGACNHHNLRTAEGRPVGAADIAEVTKQVKMVAGASNGRKRHTLIVAI